MSIQTYGHRVRRTTGQASELVADSLDERLKLDRIPARSESTTFVLRTKHACAIER